ncbi:unnamed protein product [Rotaria magnacalcarata]
MKQVMKYKIEICGLCETNIYSSGTNHIGDYTMLYSGIPIEKKTRSTFGVGILMSKSATTAWRNSGAEWEAINERIIRLRIKCEPIPINMIVIYAPINSTNKHITEVSEEFYLQLQTILDKIPQSEICIIMGDFNARTGQEQHQTMPKTVGPHTTDVTNENGVRLTDFCQTNNLIISNTFFKHKRAHQKSWMHPGTKIWHTLDYTLINKNFRSTIEDKVLSETKIAGVQLSYGKNDFCHGRKEKYENFEVLSLMYADDLVAICNSREHIETFIQVFERITQEYGLTMNVNKTCIMSSVQSKNNVNGKTIKNQQAEDVQVDIIIRNQKIETTQSFTYLGSLISNDHKADKEIKTRITKATTAFNSLRQLVWYKKRISILAKLRILRACVLPVLIYASEGWCLTKVQEDKISVFYMKCIRTILGLNLGDHVSNSAILNLSGQPSVENIMRRNRLRWFGHVNRMEKEIGKPSLTKKSYVFLSLGPSTTEACRNQKKMGI